MGSRFSCRNRDSMPDNHPSKFKVTNVNDEGVELCSGLMELTERDLVLHLYQWDSVHWPYHSLRRCGYASNLFCFESGRRSQTGQGDMAIMAENSGTEGDWSHYPHSSEVDDEQVQPGYKPTRPLPSDLLLQCSTASYRSITREAPVLSNT